MIKNDYGHLNAPYYLEKLKGGSEIYVIPRKSETCNVTVLLSKGGYQENDRTKYPLGTAYYLSNVIMDEKFKKEQAKKNIMAANMVSYSYSSYSLTSNGEDLFPALEGLMNRISTASYTENDVEKFRLFDEERIKKDESNPLFKTEKYCPKGLYLKSGIQNGISPNSIQEGQLIHATSLRRFQKSYYTGDRLAIFISGDVNPKEIIEKIKNLPLPSSSSNKEEEYKNEEVYDKVFEDVLEVKGDDDSYLTYGIKFPARKIIYEAFGQAMFFFYELLIDAAFKKNPSFLSSLADLRSELLHAELVEAGEDAYIMLSFRTPSRNELANFMSNYLSKLSKKVSSSFYDRIQNEYYVKNLGILHSPYLLCEQFARCYPNHITYPSMICHTQRLSYSSFKKFLEQIKSFQRCVVYSKI